MEQPVKTVEYWKAETLKYIQLAEEAIEEGNLIDAFYLLHTAMQCNSMALYLQSPTMLN